MSIGQGTRSRLVRLDVLELQTPQFYFAPGDTNVFTGPREVLQAVRHLSRRQEGIGLSETELRDRLNRLQELHILPEYRIQPGNDSEGGEKEVD